jgi:hypothetical protein
VAKKPSSSTDDAVAEAQLRIAAYEKQYLKLQKRNLDLEAENASSQARVKVLEEELVAAGKVEPSREAAVGALRAMLSQNPDLRKELLE